MSDGPLSFWAWGYEDRLPDDEERRELADRIEGVLGFPERPLVEYPALEDVEMPFPGLEAPGELADIVSCLRVNSWACQWDSRVSRSRPESPMPPTF